MITGPERDDLIEAVASAWRARDTRGNIRSEPAWHDLSPEDRVKAHEAATQHRLMESALDADGLSATSRLVLNRILDGS